jgi:hypothetical protein
MKKIPIFEILRVLGVLEVRQPANLQGSKASKVLKELFSEQTAIQTPSGGRGLPVFEAENSPCVGPQFIV